MPSRAKADTTILVLEAADAGAMSGVHHAAFASGWSEATFTDLMVAPHTLALGNPALGNLAPGSLAPGSLAPGNLAGPNGELTAFILLSLAADEAEILTLAVNPSFRRRGLARCLVEQAIVAAAASGAAALFLEVSETNVPALKLYGAAGFGQVGRRAGYYRSGDGADALIMKLELPG